MAVVTGKRTYRPTKGSLSKTKRIKMVAELLEAAARELQLLRKEMKAEKAARKNGKAAAR